MQNEINKINKINNNTYTKLNVKQKSLGKESRIIKEEIKKNQRKQDFWTTCDLQNHLIHVVKPEARATGLALAFMKGIKYSTVESKRKPEKEYHFQCHVIPALHRILKKYHNKDISTTEVREWIQ